MHTIIYNCFAEKSLLKKRKKHSRIAIFLLVILSLILFLSLFLHKAFSVGTSTGRIISPVSTQNIVQIFTPETLKKYNGTNSNLPIYLALDGSVYDISRGGEFYQIGGPYHYLAGRDSSDVLHVLGENIIKSKYPVIGRFVDQ